MNSALPCPFLSSFCHHSYLTWPVDRPSTIWVEVIQDFPVRYGPYADACTFDDRGRFSTEQDRGGYRPRVPMPKIKKKRKLDPEVGPTGWSCTQVHLETIRGKQERKLAELLLKLKMLHAILS